MRTCRAIALIVSAWTLSGASEPSDALTVCRVMEAPDRHHGRTITLEGYVIVGSHGVHLLEPGCGYEINLAEPDRHFPGARAFRRLVRELRGERSMVRLQATGVFVDPGEDQDPEDILLRLIGPYIDLTKVRVLVVKRLSRQDARRYQDWLAHPGTGPFHPSRD